jgi:carbamoyltransferase
MSAVLGISGHYHDAAAALVVDGRLVAAMQEERFSRIKNDPSLPRQAARACLEEAGIQAGDLDAIVVYENPFAKIERVLVSILRAFPRSIRQFPRAIGAQLGSKLWVLDQVSEMLDAPRERVTFTEHHKSHAASAFFVSPFEKAAILTVDGVGEDASTALWRGDGDALLPIESIHYPHSIGLLYAALTAYLGFEVNEGEYKVMGLAAFGAPRLRDAFHEIIHLHSDGSFELGLPYFAHMTDTELGFSPKLERLLGPRRPPGKPWDLDASEDDKRFADVAATLQQVTEEAMLGLARRARERTGEDALCLAGGVALNAVANERIARESGFSRVFVQPAAGDAGGALGAAILGAVERGDKRPAPLSTAALGQAIDPGEAKALAIELGLTCAHLSDPAEKAAELIESGRVVALATGRFEWGPRALGQRSILADPRSPSTRERLNRAIKRREPFRPFAPAVLADHARAFFEGEPDDMTPFMTTVRRTREDARALLGAVTHVDGTARVQTVTEASAPELFAVLTALGRRTGAPVALNTSLNGAREPIVAGAADAVAFFAAHSADAMIAGDVLIQRGDR